MRRVLKGDVNKDLNKNIAYIKDILQNNSDVVFREFLCGNFQCWLIYIDGLADKTLLNDYVIESLMLESNHITKSEEIKEKILTVSDLKEETDMNKCIDSILSGDTVLFIEGLPNCYVLATRSWPNRGIGEPANETAVRGSREGFTETIRFNTALIRRRIRDKGLKSVPKSIGVRSKTDVVIMYIEDIVNYDALNELMERLSSINIDSISDSGQLEQLIEDDQWSLFPQIQLTERPDVVSSSLLEGRIAILVDNSPFVLLVPTIFANFFQSPDDYYQRWIYSSSVRIIRLLAIVISMLATPLYVAITSYHTSIIPTRLAYSIAASREGVPFPAFIEAIIMEISLALLMEAIIRLPRPIGATIGIVGGLVIGQSAVSAGIVSPIMIIIVALTAITSFTTTNYEISFAFRIIRFAFIIMASTLGLYGIALGCMVTLAHLTKLESFGISYLSPIVNLDKGDIKDTIVKYPIRFFTKRPQYMKTGDKVRQNNKGKIGR
ncbi:spore germination protein [Clostridium algidicarnis]|uniref:spore germination protein n=1 Tax=Clostridium algidicarnis TaxID=37659 RepID=UPI001C0CDFF0|nr:spore germination protein [Clostridium algidicarnis]MBU3209802.1 spore germination protein [Clostridium algidicarnis]MBU3228595.1 spore germination protein [Clostridium algidicarnis]MBU3251928.1 spore germination protein [Clostridium algidicarnis]